MNTQAGLPEQPRKRRVAVSDDLALGTSRGAHCSIRASRFRLINANGEETLIPNLHLDVVIIRANPKTSKLYYEGTFSQDNAAPPACYSDNGVGPSSNALRPQSPTCGICPHNQMNSKINPTTGKGSKACSDRQKVAFIIQGDTAVNVYELQVPPDSLSNLRAYRDFLRQQKDKPDIGEMVTRLSFDPQASHPRLKFEPVDFANDAHTMQMIDYIYDQGLDIQAVGLNDVAADPDMVKQTMALRTQYAQIAPRPQNGQQAPQFQLPPRQPVVVPSQVAEAVSLPVPGKKPVGRPKKVVEQAPAPQVVPTPQPFTPVPATPVTAPGMPDVPEFLRRPPAVTSTGSTVPTQSAQPQPAINPQFGMAGAPPPPPNVTEALQTAMRMPPRR